MAFPSNPTDQQEYVAGTKTFRYNATTGRWNIFRPPSAGSSTITQADLDAAIANADSGTEAVADVNALPESPEAGDMALVSSTNNLYLYNGSAWFNIALSNQAPTAISGNQAIYELATDGTPTVVTLTSTDPEGFPLTWSATTSGDILVGTVTNVDNIFTVTPSTNQNDAGTLSVTFSVTDGNNTETSISSFTLVFIPDWSAVSQQAKLQYSDAQTDDRIGFSVAISGDTAIVGVNDGFTTRSQSVGVNIFTRSGSTWTEQATIQSSDIELGDRFGWSVAIDGDTAIVGAPRVKLNGSFAGAAYIFTRSGSTWTEQAKIQSSDLEASDDFGFSVAISGDTVVVGATGEDTPNNATGAVYVFTRSGSAWTEQQKIQASDGSSSTAPQLGVSVAIDGDTVIAGAKYEDTGGSNAGAAYIFTRSGSTWSEQQKIISSDLEASDEFGATVAIDGDTAVISAPEEAAPSAIGAVYVFTRSGSTWTEQQKILASDGQNGDRFGLGGVTIQDNTIVVGAPQEDTGGNSAGAAYIFTRDGSTWTEQIKIQSNDVHANAQFGRSLGIDGDTIIAGAYAQNVGAATSAGAAYIFVAV